MLSSALSMPATASSSMQRDKSHQNNLRSKSQPANENRYSFIAPSSPPPANPMKNFFGNLLRLTPHRYVTTTTNRSKISSSLSTTIPSDRSSRLKPSHPSVVSSLSIHSTNVLSSHDIRPPTTKLTLKFRRAGNAILFAIYWCNVARKKNQLRSMVYQSYLQTSALTEKYMFDKSNFKIQAFEILPIVQDFFKQPPGRRDVMHADEIRKCLADIKPFTRLPKILQDQLLQKASYECYPEQRTIVRQGERSACFYIILSGSVIPTYKRAMDGNVETLDVLKRGSTFGEKGLMTDSTQNFTVTSKTKLELLVLWKDDFKSIFMTKDRHCSTDDLRFLKTHVSFLRGFPIERLHEIPNAIQHCHFGPSEVIAKDSRRMKHLFVVKKGSLAIWKRLDPNGSNRETAKNIENDKLIDNEDEATGDNRTLFSEIQLSGDINESQSNTNSLDADFRLSRLRRSPIDEPRISSGLSTASRTVANDPTKFPGLIDKRDRLQLVNYNDLTINNNPTKLTLTDALSKPNRSVVKPTIKPKLINPDKMIYIHVKTLNEGQQFGLTDMMFPNQPELTLISNECECLLLNKSSFLHFASDQYKQNIRRSEIPYPNDTVFYKTYHTNEVWKRFSKQVYIDAYGRINQQHPQNRKRSISIKEQQQPILISAV